MKKISITFLVLLLSLPTLAFAVTHYHSAPPSVDNGEIRWGTYHGSTQYTTARSHAISKWDAVGAVNIAGDTSTTIEDLSFTDYYYEGDELAYWQPMNGADVIGFNEYNFDDMTSSQQKKSAMHEIGHALGLAEHNSTAGSIMRQGIISQTELSDHDITDVKNKW